jgi:hypothetical protein
MYQSGLELYTVADAGAIIGATLRGTLLVLLNAGFETSGAALTIARGGARARREGLGVGRRRLRLPLRCARRFERLRAPCALLRRRFPLMPSVVQRQAPSNTITASTSSAICIERSIG